jgi:hypothetical protein
MQASGCVWDMTATSHNQSTTAKEYVESPSWRFSSHENRDATLPKISATFIFAKRLEQLDHIRLNALNDALRKDARLWEALVEPTDSFFSDIVRGWSRTSRTTAYLLMRRTVQDR